MAGLGVSCLQNTAPLHHGAEGHELRLRSWDHFSVVTKIEGRELRTKKGVKGWAGWPGWACKSEAGKIKFQELVLCPRSDRDQAVLRDGDDDEGLAFLQERLVDAAAAVKATTTASRNRNKLCVPDEIRDMASEAAKCRKPGEEKGAAQDRS